MKTTKMIYRNEVVKFLGKVNYDGKVDQSLPNIPQILNRIKFVNGFEKNVHNLELKNI